MAGSADLIQGAYDAFAQGDIPAVIDSLSDDVSWEVANGLTLQAIPLEARVLAVADAYEAMTSDRVYRPALTPDAAREELLRCSGSQFDSRVVEAFLAVLDREESARELGVAG